MNQSLQALKTSRKWLRAVLDNEPNDYDNQPLKRALVKVEAAIAAFPAQAQLLHAADLLAAFADGTIEDSDRRDVDSVVKDLRELAATARKTGA